MMPALIGMTIHEAPRLMKTQANGFAFLVYNLLGYLPAPFLYGGIQNISGQGSKSHYGMGLLMFWTVLGNLFLFLAGYQKYGKKSKREDVPES